MFSRRALLALQRCFLDTRCSRCCSRCTCTSHLLGASVRSRATTTALPTLRASAFNSGDGEAPSRFHSHAFAVHPAARHELSLWTPEHFFAPGGCPGFAAWFDAVYISSLGDLRTGTLAALDELRALGRRPVSMRSCGLAWMDYMLQFAVPAAGPGVHMLPKPTPPPVMMRTIFCGRLCHCVHRRRRGCALGDIRRAEVLHARGLEGRVLPGAQCRSVVGHRRGGCRRGRREVCVARAGEARRCRRCRTT